MIALDTNLLIRLMVDDNPAQSDIAERLVRDNRVFVSKTVLLESEWVLRHSYRFDRQRIAWFFRQIFEPWNTVIENPEQIAKAIDWYEAGSDFADALHLASSATATLHTLDRKFCKAAREAGIAPEVSVWEV
ncbi:MAG TPA: type II toxin-antitoxin system VapC family toxin [Methylococcaceae bacterium]|nr:type II toxin-antitoxin system VapC family toxin [Methylococcaceae bacterium]